MDEMFPLEIQAIRDSVNRFMETEVAPVIEDLERSGTFPRELIRKAGEMGFFGSVFPESVGGTSVGYLAAAVVTEEMSRNDVRFAACVNQQASLTPYCIYSAGVYVGK